MRITATMNIITRTAPILLALTGMHLNTIDQVDPFIARVFKNLDLDMAEHVLNKETMTEALNDEKATLAFREAMTYLLESCEFLDGDFDVQAHKFSKSMAGMLQTIMGTDNAEYNQALSNCTGFEGAEKVTEQFADELREPLLIAHAELREKTGMTPQTLIAVIPMGLSELHSAMTQLAIIERVVFGDSTLTAEQVKDTQAFFVSALTPKNDLDMPEELFQILMDNAGHEQPPFIKYV